MTAREDNGMRFVWGKKGVLLLSRCVRSFSYTMKVQLSLGKRKVFCYILSRGVRGVQRKNSIGVVIELNQTNSWSAAVQEAVGFLLWTLPVTEVNFNREKETNQDVKPYLNHAAGEENEKSGSNRVNETARDWTESGRSTKAPKGK